MDRRRDVPTATFSQPAGELGAREAIGPAGEPVEVDLK
jgi:hypothetical protein